MSNQSKVLGAVLLWFVTLGFALMAIRLVGTDEVGELSPSPQPLISQARESTLDDQQPASLRLTWTDPTPVYANSMQGVVTWVDLRAGDELEQGDRVMDVDGIGRIAVSTQFPFWRPLGPGDRGTDVAELEELLGALGLHDGQADEVYDTATSAAVRTLSTQLGAPASDTFDPGATIWLPRSPFSLHRVAVAPGQPIGPGTVILEGEPELVAAEVVTSEGLPMHLVDPESRSFASGDLSLRLAPDSPTRIDDAWLDEVASSTSPDQSQLDGAVELTRPRAVVVVPVTSVVVGPQGTYCVWLVQDQSFRPQPVEVLSGTFEETAVSGIDAGESILVNPASQVESRECRSN